MELTQHSLLEELIMAPKTETPFANEFFPSTWNMNPFEQTPDLHHLPLTNTSLLELISPPDFNYPCPFGEFQPFLDALASPDYCPLYEKDDLPAMAVQEDQFPTSVDSRQVGFLDSVITTGFEDGVSCFKVESSQIDDTLNADSTTNVGLCGDKKCKVKKPNGQPSKNLMAERRRRKRLNDRLSMLRSIVPKISKMDRTSILGDTIDYMRELLEKIHKLREEGIDENTNGVNLMGKYLKELKPNETLVRNPPKFDVERRSEDTRVEVCCTAKPGLLLSTLSTLDALGLDIQQCVISCFNDFSLQASCYEVAEHRALISSEDVKQALFRNAGYGGRCL
ncbi:UNVERIFIED_CONTAM: Transcription factor [Sesamum calycinum]|uniref:Transcription factor n=1 Tax=Sesamum calycinum TaxID=2727403 RepID=A0AAW2MLD7_9LAMI